MENEAKKESKKKNKRKKAMHSLHGFYQLCYESCKAEIANFSISGTNSH
jgi:hypothetical protein